MSITSLRYDLRVGLSTVSRIIKDTLNAIYEALKDVFLKLSDKCDLEEISQTRQSHHFQTVWELWMEITLEFSVHIIQAPNFTTMTLL